ncbi:MAG: alanine dehydrogenase [Candidatus Azobacteroides sp.]|nr:alanine dehydrogenase [Candidatus Azobacteroides sp.]
MKSSFTHIHRESYFPEECPVSVKYSKKSLIIGIPKENRQVEKRLPLTPEAVAQLVEAGHRVIVESEAGLGINYADIHYSEAGAEIADSPAEVFLSDIILKISQPAFDEIQMMKPGAVIFSMLQFTPQSLRIIEAMLEKKINAVGYELIGDDDGSRPIVKSISEIEGNYVITVASELLSNSFGGKGVLLGGIPGISPTEVIILGAGLSGLVAARAAMALGATVKVFDYDIDHLRTARERLGNNLFTSNFHDKVFRNALKSADVIIGTIRYINGSERFQVPEELVRIMKKGAVIIDLSVGHGGCFATSDCEPEKQPKVYEKFGILHYCVPNLSSRVARTAAMAMSNILVPLILDAGNHPHLNNLIKAESSFRSGIYLYKGKVVNRYVSGYFNLPLSDIGLYLEGF